MGLQISQALVYAKGWLDFRGTMGVDRSASVGFTRVEMLFRIDTDADEAAVRKLIELTERYCVIYQTLIAGTPVSSGRVE